MSKVKKMEMMLILIMTFFISSALGEENGTSLFEAFTKGKVNGSLKSYYFTQSFDGAGKNDSHIRTYGGNLKYVTGQFYGLNLGANFQGSFVGYKDDPDNKTAGSMDAQGVLLSEAYVQYEIYETQLKGGRQFFKSPLLAGSGSRLLNESFETYLITNKGIPNTIITAGLARKYQTRTDKSNYGDNWFVNFEENGTGEPGEFYDIGNDGMYFIYLKNNSIKNLDIQTQYANVVDEVSALYADARYQFDVALNPYFAAQYYHSYYDASTNKDNYLYGLKTGLNIAGIDLFAGYSSAGGSAGDTRVFRGVGQSAYYQYTSTTKTAGNNAFEAGTKAYQLGVSHHFKGLNSMFKFTNFDNPNVNAGLEEYTLNFLYNFSGYFKGFKISIDFSVLDYEENTKDATDLRSRLIYSF